MKDVTVVRAVPPEGRGADPALLPGMEPQRTFGEYLSELIPYGLYILGTAILFAVLGFAATVRQPKEYQATAKMLVKTKPDLDPGSRAVETANLMAVLQAETLQRAAHEALKLDQPSVGVAFPSFQSRVTVRQVPATNVILVQVVLPSPAHAAEAANLICTSGVNESRRLNQQEALSTRDMLNAQADGAMQRLEETERALNEFTSRSQVEVLKTDVESTLLQRSQVPSLQVALASLEAKLAVAEQELKQQPRVNTLTRALDRDPALAQAAAQSAPNGSAPGLYLKEEEINTVARDLQQTVTDTRVAIAGIKREERELRNMKVHQPALRNVAELHVQELQQARLQAEYTIAKKVYEDTKLRSQQASLDIANRSSTLQLFDPASRPILPVGPHPVRTAGLALLCGFAIAVLAATAAISVRQTRRRIVGRG